MSENNYVNAFTDRDDIIIIERDKDGKRVIKREPLDYIYYTLDDNGDMTTIFGEKCRQNVATSKKNCRRQLQHWVLIMCTNPM